VWRDPAADGSALAGLPEGLPIIAVDPPASWGDARDDDAEDDDDDAAPTLIAAPASSPELGEARVLTPPYAADAATALDTSACVVVDGAAPSVFDAETLPVVELLAASSAGRGTLLVSLLDAPQLQACCEKLVLGGLASAATAALGDAAGTGVGSEEEQLRSGMGVALPPDPYLWAQALSYKM